MNNENILKSILNKIDKKTVIKKKLFDDMLKLKAEKNELVMKFNVITFNIDKGEKELEQLVKKFFY
jgi:hypothetical protein